MRQGAPTLQNSTPKQHRSSANQRSLELACRWLARNSAKKRSGITQASQKANTNYRPHLALVAHRNANPISNQRLANAQSDQVSIDFDRQDTNNANERHVRTQSSPKRKETPRNVTTQHTHRQIAPKPQALDQSDESC